MTEKNALDSLQVFVFDGAPVRGEIVEYRDWETDRKSTRLNSSHRL